MTHYIAVDIGASSGRLLCTKFNEKKLDLIEIHRFKNQFSQKDDHNRWDIDQLIQEIFIGLEKVKQQGIDKCFLGIDTWAVDYVMLSSKGEKIADPISYRDARTKNAVEELTKKVSKKEIYQKTGIQFLDFNTLYQLYVENQENLKMTETLLFIPDYIGYVLTGKKVTEVTNASTSQMLNLRENLFDAELLSVLNIDSKKFAPLVDSGTYLGEIKENWYQTYDLPKCEVITVATHDTASAVVGTPATTDNWAYLSSGTWSLIGVESMVPIVTESAFNNNFTNEWGAYGTYRFLKNIMGLWIIQEIVRLENNQYSFSELVALAEKEPFFTSLINVNDSRFINPENMILEIKKACQETGEIVPETIGEIVNCVYSSLAKSYQEEFEAIQTITGKELEALYIVGGGSNVSILNQLTANLIKKPVYAGPSEATAIGNLIVQMIATGNIDSLAIGRKLISQSFEIKEFLPQKGNYHDK